ncbi:hypothetical protein UF75_3143 [Desulfosporosinus sp. I2]|nr:hypothetical protein UF75_3143 [Desulfosporosinus sp. I2]
MQGRQIALYLLENGQHWDGRTIYLFYLRVSFSILHLRKDRPYV